jgi:hypothetical protein
VAKKIRLRELLKAFAIAGRTFGGCKPSDHREQCSSTLESRSGRPTAEAPVAPWFTTCIPLSQRFPLP